MELIIIILRHIKNENLKFASQQYRTWSDCMDVQAGLALYWCWRLIKRFQTQFSKLMLLYEILTNCMDVQASLALNWWQIWCCCMKFRPINCYQLLIGQNAYKDIFKREKMSLWFFLKEMKAKMIINKLSSELKVPYLTRMFERPDKLDIDKWKDKPLDKRILSPVNKAWNCLPTS